MPTKTDNSYFRDKVELRLRHLPAGKVRVLDCYSGKGLIWAAVKKLSKQDVQTLPIDQRADKFDFHLHGNNLEYLQTIDLSRFNVVDLDAYGVPFDQIECLVERKYRGVVFVTMIQAGPTRLPFSLLEKIGFTRSQIEKVPTLFGKRGWQYFLEYLAAVGVKKVHHRFANGRARRHYLAMALG